MRTLLLTALVVACCATVPAAAGAADCGDSQPCQCGDTLVGAYRLDADLGPCEGNGLVLRKRATLDCRGHTIRGPGGDGRAKTPTFGIVLDGTAGAVVRGCKVTGFNYGIELSGARNSRVTGCETFRNGDFQAHAGYGIHLSRSVGNTIEDCTVRDSADEGIHVGSGSDDNVLSGNQASDNGRENFYILDARGNRLVKNRGRGVVTADLYMKHAVDSVIEGNQFEGHAVVVRGASSGNLFADDVFGAGITFEAYGEGAQAAAPTKNVVRGGRIEGRGPCIRFFEAHENRVEAVTFRGCAGLLARAAKPARNDLARIDVAGVRLDVAGGAMLRLLSPVRVAVRSADGKPVAGARVAVQDGTGESSEGPATGADGVAACLVATHVVNAAGLVPLTPVTVNVTAEGYAPGKAVLGDPPADHVDVTLAADGAGAPPEPPKRPSRAPKRSRSKSSARAISVT